MGDPILALRGGESTVVPSELPTSTESLGSYTVMAHCSAKTAKTERHVADSKGAKMECCAALAKKMR